MINVMRMDGLLPALLVQVVYTPTLDGSSFIDDPAGRQGEGTFRNDQVYYVSKFE